MAEFEANLAALDTSRSFQLAVTESTNTLFALAAGSAPVTPDSLDLLLGNLTWWTGTSNFTTGTLDAVVLGGQLPLISDRNLRARLAQFRRILEDLAENEAQDYHTFRDLLMPFFRQRTYLPQISNAQVHKPGDPSMPAAPDVVLVEQRTDHTALLASREFQNLLLQKSWVQADILVGYDILEQEIEELLRLLAQQ